MVGEVTVNLLPDQSKTSLIRLAFDSDAPDFVLKFIYCRTKLLARLVEQFAHLVEGNAFLLQSFRIPLLRVPSVLVSLSYSFERLLRMPRPTVEWVQLTFNSAPRSSVGVGECLFNVLLEVGARKTLTLESLNHTVVRLGYTIMKKTTCVKLRISETWEYSFDPIFLSKKNAQQIRVPLRSNLCLYCAPSDISSNERDESAQNIAGKSQPILELKGRSRSSNGRTDGHENRQGERQTDQSKCPQPLVFHALRLSAEGPLVESCT